MPASLMWLPMRLSARAAQRAVLDHAAQLAHLRVAPAKVEQRQRPALAKRPSKASR